MNSHFVIIGEWSESPVVIGDGSLEVSLGWGRFLKLLCYVMGTWMLLVEKGRHRAAMRGSVKSNDLCTHTFVCQYCNRLISKLQ